jgi:hypothetical protein
MAWKSPDTHYSTGSVDGMPFYYRVYSFWQRYHIYIGPDCSFNSNAERGQNHLSRPRIVPFLTKRFNWLWFGRTARDYHETTKPAAQILLGGASYTGSEQRTNIPDECNTRNNHELSSPKIVILTVLQG